MPKKKSLTREYIETVGQVYREKGLFPAIGYELNSTLHSLASRIVNTFALISNSNPTYDTDPNGAGGWKKGSTGEREYLDNLWAINARARGRHEFLLRQKRMKYIPSGEEERIELRHGGSYGYEIILHKPGKEDKLIAGVGISNMGKKPEKPWIVSSYIMGNPDYGIELDKIKTLEEANSIALRQANKLARKLTRQRRLPLEHLVIEDDKERGEKRLANEIDSLRLRRVSSIIFLFAGITLSVFSLQSTGNAIGNLTGTSQGLLGLIFFVVGIAGLVFSKK
ncbi:MAG: hypothetical protein NTW17_02190 [Candidatus Pacearchaeota archaeon]|nr:hypothetical protein [Candidatus Pacearchaeota archaeon]